MPTLNLKDLCTKIARENDFFLDLLIDLDAALNKRFVELSDPDKSALKSSVAKIRGTIDTELETLAGESVSPLACGGAGCGSIW